MGNGSSIQLGPIWWTDELCRTAQSPPQEGKPGPFIYPLTPIACWLPPQLLTPPRPKTEPASYEKPSQVSEKALQMKSKRSQDTHLRQDTDNVHGTAHYAVLKSEGLRNVAQSTKAIEQDPSPSFWDPVHPTLLNRKCTQKVLCDWWDIDCMFQNGERDRNFFSITMYSKYAKKTGFTVWMFSLFYSLYPCRILEAADPWENWKMTEHKL